MFQSGTIEQRFRSKVFVAEPDACWPWSGASLPRGYGKITDVAGRTLLAHRVAWELEHGEIPAGMLVLHHCDNPRCCNPAHLYVGTYADNSADALSRGRMPRGDGHYSRRFPSLVSRGEGHTFARLTDEDIPSVFVLRAAGWSIRRIARYFNIAANSIKVILNGTGWRHVWGAI